MVTVCYIVMDVPESLEFYTKHLGFTIALDARPGFAVVARGPLQLALSGVAGQGGGSRPMSATWPARSRACELRVRAFATRS